MEDLDKTIAPRREHVSSGADDVTMPGKRNRKPDGRFTVGDLIMDRYKILAELGQGGMGVVYKCFDETAGIEVALKALPPELSHNTLEMEDIRDNFQLVAKLVHQNIAITKNLERDNLNGNYYLIMECCEGEDLRRWIKRKRRESDLKFEDVLPIIQQVAAALDYAHEMKIMHRDIKPGNIMIDQFGKIKVLDFGLAAQIHTSMTRVSMAYHGTSGTGPYMAPEQWRGKAQGAPADQYALAVMTYEMLAGRLPFESTDAAVLKQAVLDEIADEIPGIPKVVQEAIKRAMSKDPAERFASCADFAAALAGKKIKTAQGQKNGDFSKWAAVVIMLAVLGVAVGGYYFFDKQQKEKIRLAKIAADKAEKERQPKIAADKAEKEFQAKLEQEKAEKLRQQELAARQVEKERQARLAQESAREENLRKIAAENARKKYLAKLEQEELDRLQRQQQAEKDRVAAENKRRAEHTLQQKKFASDAEKHFKNSEFNLALSNLQKLSAPTPQQLHQMAICYQYMNESVKAFNYFRRAFERGYRDPECQLGLLYGKKNQWTQAANYYEIILKSTPGNNVALLRLAIIYLYGRGGQHNQALGKEYLEQAARNGNAKAMFNLGCCYAKFKGLDFAVFEFSRDKAVYWLRKAHQAGIAQAGEKLKILGEK